VTVNTLDVETYDLAEASRYLRVPHSTLQWWLEGGVRSGHSYAPVIRELATGSRTLTWGEFVEAWYVRQYRREHAVELASLRQLGLRLRDHLGVRYPLAHAKPFVGPGRQLVKQLQDEIGLPQDLWIVIAGRTDQLVLTPTMTQFIDRVEFSADGLQPAVAIRPRGKSSPVGIRPDHAFGSPNVRGIRTEALAELVDAGEDLDDVATDFGITPHELRAALAYEWEQEPVAAA
jgi:uncharacterized protein (DUF433 family)